MTRARLNTYDTHAAPLNSFRLGKYYTRIVIALYVYIDYDRHTPRDDVFLVFFIFILL